MRVFAACLVLVVVRAQTNINTVCNNIVNSLDCMQFPERPVCGSDGRQFRNECEFTKAHCLDANLKVLQDGSCSVVVTAPTIQTSAGTGTRSTSTPTGPATTVTIPPDVVQTSQAAGSPSPTETSTMATTTDPNLSALCNQVVNTPCQAAGNPLCGTNGNTYSNYCEFSKARCYLPGLQLAYSGTCSSTDTFLPLTSPIPTTQPPSVFDIICRTLQQVACQPDDTSVCASNSMVYNSACEFEKAKCQDPTLTANDC